MDLHVTSYTLMKNKKVLVASLVGKVLKACLLPKTNNLRYIFTHIGSLLYIHTYSLPCYNYFHSLLRYSITFISNRCKTQKLDLEAKSHPPWSHFPSNSTLSILLPMQTCCSTRIACDLCVMYTTQREVAQYLFFLPISRLRLGTRLGERLLSCLEL